MIRYHVQNSLEIRQYEEIPAQMGNKFEFDFEQE